MENERGMELGSIGEEKEGMREKGKKESGTKERRLIVLTNHQHRPEQRTILFPSSYYNAASVIAVSIIPRNHTIIINFCYKATIKLLLQNLRLSTLVTIVREKAQLFIHLHR